MRLPFNIYDGKKTRACTYEDLFIIVEFALDATVYTHEKEWLIFNKKLYGMGTLMLLYASIKALKQANHGLYYSSLVVVDSTRIARVKCKDLHKWKDNSLVRLMMQLEGIV